MYRTFELFHLSLLSRQQDLFSEKSEWEREDWLRHAFKENFEFEHRGNTFHWVPWAVDGADIIGIIQRQTSRQYHQPPREGGAEMRGMEWQGAIAVIDPSSHDTGQRAAIERDASVGTPRSLLKSILASINERANAPYTIEFKPIFDQQTFWAFAAKHRYRLKSITFDFVMPNMWGTRSNLEKELKDTRDETGADKAKVNLSGSDGVGTDNDRVKEGVGYAGDGGGSVSAKSLDGESFSSTKKNAKTKVLEPLDQNADEQIGFWKKVSKKVLAQNE